MIELQSLVALTHNGLADLLASAPAESWDARRCARSGRCVT
jgi:hypothetical protein